MGNMSESLLLNWKRVSNDNDAADDQFSNMIVLNDVHRNLKGAIITLVSSFVEKTFGFLFRY